MKDKPAIAPLLSQFPAFNHAFMLREIMALRQAGFSIFPVSIVGPPVPVEQLTPAERTEYDRTFYVNRRPLAGVVADHLTTLFRHPGGYLRGLGGAWRMAGGRVADWPRCLRYFAGAVVAGRAMERAGYTHFHSHFCSTIAWLVLLVFENLTGSIAIHGPMEFDDVAGFRLADKIKASRFMVAISDYGRSQMMRCVPADQWGKIHVRRLGVDTGLYQLTEPRPDPRPFTMLSAGRLDPVKGFPVLLEAVALLCRRGLDVQLRVAGGGGMLEWLERRKRELGIPEERVIFEGWKSGDEMPALYAGADAFVLASFAEGIPVVLMEAMARGVPCIATAVHGTPELVVHRETGLLVPPGNAEALAEAVAQLIEDRELRLRLAAAGRRMVLERYELSENARALAELFEKLLPAAGETRTS